MTAVTEICNYLALSPTLATSGQPTESQFVAIQAAGYGRVVNLAMPTSTNWLPKEPEIVTGLGMEYIAIPVVWDYPTLDDLEQLFAILEETGEQPIWVHCALNMRVSAMMYLYNRLKRGMAASEAKSLLEKIWVPNETWQNFIDAAIELYAD